MNKKFSRALMASIMKNTRRKRLRTNLPIGALSSFSAAVLCKIAKYSSGPILEVGSYVGRSTAAIIYGIIAGNKRRVFITIDLHPPVDPVNNRMHKYYGQNIKDTFVALKDNMKKLKFDSYVTMLKGDFLEITPPKIYGFIFMDVTHDKPEIDKNIPGIIQHVCRGTILACHDIIDDKMTGWLENHIRFLWKFRDERIFVGKIATCNIP